VRKTAATRPCTHRKSQVVPPATPRDAVNDREDEENDAGD
jgi:hypothetical protein